MNIVARHPTNTGWKSFYQYSIVYLAWFASIALSAIFLWLLRSSIDQWYVVLDFNPWAHSLVARSFVFIGGLSWLIFIFFVEGYLRAGITRQLLRQRVIQVFAVLIILIGIVALSLAVIAPYLGVSS